MLGPLLPWMIDERIAAIRREELDQLSALVLGEARAHADVLQRSRIIEQAEQQRADRGLRRTLVPSKARDHAIAIALVLDLEHHALVRLIGARGRLGHDAVETGAFEAAEPVGGDILIVGCRRQMERRLGRRRAAIRASRDGARNGSPRRSRSPSQSRSKNTIEAGICCASSFTREAAG